MDGIFEALKYFFDGPHRANQMHLQTSFDGLSSSMNFYGVQNKECFDFKSFDHVVIAKFQIDT